MNNLDKKNVEELIKVSDYLLYDTITDLSDKKTISLPISELASLGVAASSLESKIRTVTETTNIDTKGLYRLYNQEKGDILKKCKDGSYWGLLILQMENLNSQSWLSRTNSTDKNHSDAY